MLALGLRRPTYLPQSERRFHHCSACGVELCPLVDRLCISQRNDRKGWPQALTTGMSDHLVVYAGVLRSCFICQLRPLPDNR